MESEKAQNGTCQANGKQQSGPDQVLPADNRYTDQLNGAVQLAVGEKTSAPGDRPVSIPTALANTAHRFPTNVALKMEREGAVQVWTYAQYLADVRACARAFIQLGLDRLNSVAIIGFNSPHWCIANLAAIFAGGISTGVYTTNTSEACHYQMSDASCQIVVVEDEQQLQKVWAVRDRLPQLKAIVQYTGKPTQSGVLSWSDLMQLGRNLNKDKLNARLREIAINNCAILIYTSGTTGPPKGAMMSHDNVTWTARTVNRHFGTRDGQEVMISYLPLSHLAAQMMDVYSAINCAATMVFAQPDALSGGSLVTTLKSVRPTIFLAVPRIWEKIEARMRSAETQASYFKQSLLSWARGVASQYVQHLHSGGQPYFSVSQYLAERLVLDRVKGAMGLDRCRIMLTGAAPISADTLQYLASLGLLLLQVYGMTESCGPHTCQSPANYRVASVGVTLPGCSTSIAEPSTTGGADGEVLMRGRNVFMGYVNKRQHTEDTLQADGWLHSGDTGRLDTPNPAHLYITGRIKELLITAGGENVAPLPIEDAVKAQLPCVSHAVLIGDHRKFLSMLLTLKTETDKATGRPTDILDNTALQWCRQVAGCDDNVTSVTQIVTTRNDKVYAAIQAGIDKANERAISRAQKVNKWSLLETDFSMDGGELGPTMKLKRPVVVEKYAKIISAMYDV